jgi:hypothetical protein
VSETKELLRRGVGDFEPTSDAFDRVLARRDRKHRNQRVAAGVLGVAVFALAAIGFVRLLGSESTPASDPRSPFEGTWVSTSDADGGTQTMTVGVSADGAVEIVVLDDVATVCSGTPSTMTGTGRIEAGTQLVIPAPVYTCDDGSVPETLSGPPLEEQLRDWTLFLEAETDTLTDGVGGTWVREGAEVPSPDPTTSGGMWPQSSLEEVFEAQELADASDPRYTWQVDPVLAAFADGDAAEDPLGAEIFERFIREEFGWEEFSGFAVMGYAEGGGHVEGVLFIRCAPGRTNPLYPKIYPEMPPEVRGCAPTIDDSRYETVRFNVEQPAGRGPSGIWVVTGWELLEPAEPGSLYEHLYPDFEQRQVEQVAPPSNAEVTALLQAFLEARVDGEGAETYLHPREAEGPAAPDEEVPLLYATTGGTPYERSEIERVQGPVWPTGWIELKVRLFAEDGTVVEQSFVVVRQEDGRLGLVYGSPSSRVPTTENGQAVPVPYSFLDGEVTFAAAPPWSDTILDRTFTVLGGVGRGSASQFTMFTLVADPLTATGCEAGPAPADAEALVRSIRSNPDLEATAPVAVSAGGIDALRMDVVAPGRPEVSDCAPMVLGQLSLAQGDGRMRLYLLDLPEGMSARILAIAISALDSEFERVAEAAAPVLDSFEFHPR